VRRTSLAAAGWFCLFGGLALLGCRPGASLSSDSGVRGRVLVGPACPAVRVGEACPDQPYPAQVDVVTPDGKLLARVAADEQGEFAIGLPEGAYTLLAMAADDSPLPWAEPIEIVVHPGVWTEVMIQMDSGIR